jgi:hypothetical protein
MVCGRSEQCELSSTRSLNVSWGREDNRIVLSDLEHDPLDPLHTKRARQPSPGKQERGRDQHQQNGAGGVTSVRRPE